MKLSSGATTGERCQCGADVFSYYEAPDERGKPLEALAWRWVFVCEAGHWQHEPEPEPVQLSFLEIV